MMERTCTIRLNMEAIRPNLPQHTLMDNLLEAEVVVVGVEVVTVDRIKVNLGNRSDSLVFFLQFHGSIFLPQLTIFK